MEPSTVSVERDVDLILRSMSLCSVIRYQHQRFWESQTESAQRALAIDTVSPNGNPIPRSESVADHSWHLADSVLIVAPRFPELDLSRCVMLAILHDKLEIWTGDADPIGLSGDGSDTHAFNIEKKLLKNSQERKALETYLAHLNESARPLQKELFVDMIEQRTPESKFVKAWDRLQTIPYMLARKDGAMEDKHLHFSISYLSESLHHYPAVKPYYYLLLDKLLSSIAERRGMTLETLKYQLRGAISNT